MKIKAAKQAGSILVLTLLTAGVIGITLVSYLELVSAQNKSVSRSQNWNAAIPASEAGIEEARTHLNVVGDGDRGTNGWSLVNGLYHMSLTNGDWRYETDITSNNPPVVTCTGYIKVPINNTELSRRIVVTSR